MVRRSPIACDATGRERHWRGGQVLDNCASRKQASNSRGAVADTAVKLGTIRCNRCAQTDGDGVQPSEADPGRATLRGQQPWPRGAESRMGAAKRRQTRSGVMIALLRMSLTRYVVKQRFYRSAC